MNLHNQQRRGAIVPLFALLLIPMLGMLAFSIDAGYMVLVRTDLQNTADAAALAGAEKLQELYVQYNMPGQTQQAAIMDTATTNQPGSPMDTAERFSSYNKAGNVYITLPDSDVEFGYTNAQGNYFPHWPGFPNTIQVTVRRDGTANGSLGLFFGRVLGMSSIDVQATARATIYSGTVSSLKAIPGVNAHILPVALDYKNWDQFYATGQSPDGIRHSNAVNGMPEMQVYPATTNTPGNFGLLDVGPPENNIPAFRNWIDYGETPNDISYLLNNNLLPVSMQSPKSWKCGPGLKDSLENAFQSQIGVPNLIPLFQAAQYPSISNNNYIAAAYQGQTATYNIVGFVGVTISYAGGNGNANLVISIQPMAVIDPTAVILNNLPAGTQGSPVTPSTSTNTTITTFTSAKLTY